jgi:hypothetical protein
MIFLSVWALIHLLYQKFYHHFQLLLLPMASPHLRLGSFSHFGYYVWVTLAQAVCLQVTRLEAENFILIEFALHNDAPQLML